MTELLPPISLLVDLLSILLSDAGSDSLKYAPWYLRAHFVIILLVAGETSVLP